jgi:molecular chaperone GrpE
MTDQENNIQNNEELSEETQAQYTKEQVEEQKYQENIALLNTQLEEMQDKLLRSLAESENIRLRSGKMIEEAKEYSIITFAKDLIPVIDNFSRALDHIPENISDDMKNIVDGIKMTKQELESVFEKHGLESIKPLPGDKFDYNNHHAISQIEKEDYTPGSIVDTMQIGYKIKNRLIRPAAVIVSKK